MAKEYETKKHIKFIEIHVTCPNINTAEKIANTLVNNKYAACVQIMSMWKSVYLWNGKIEKNDEILLIIKTRSRYFNKIEKAVKEIHPYTTPEIIALPIIKENEDYIRWIDESLGLKTIDFENDKSVKVKKAK